MILKYLPSKKFFKIASGVLVLIVLGYFGFLYNKTYNAIKNPEITTVTTPVKDVIEKDTDNDGVRDWEEALWGTNPENPSTFGMPDKDYIEKKRQEIAALNQINTQTTSGAEPVNDTEKIAREFLSTIIALQQSGSFNQENISKLAQKFATDIGQTAAIDNRYKDTDLSLSGESTEAKKAYYLNITKIIAVAKSGGMGGELNTISDFFSQENSDNTPILSLSNTYSKLASALLKTSVPPSAKTFHLDLLNLSFAMSTIFKNISATNDNPIVALVGVSQYQNYESKLESSIIALTNYFRTSGIIK